MTLSPKVFTESGGPTGRQTIACMTTCTSEITGQLLWIAASLKSSTGNLFNMESIQLKKLDLKKSWSTLKQILEREDQYLNVARSTFTHLFLAVTL
jgi:hypothetical protein